MGQNFLIHQPTLDKIIEAADINSKDTVLEIGPGIGTLTQPLAQKAGKVIAIEKDRAMVGILKETLQGFNNTEIIHDDILKIGDWPLGIGNYKIVANLPYYITSPIIRMFLESGNPPQTMVLMVQKEVGQRICAKPPNMSILAVSVQFYATAKIIAKVSKECFWPAPNVDSAIIKIIPHKELLSPSADLFFKVVKAGFLQPRKQLGNNLSKALKADREKVNAWLLHNNLSPLQRAETLTIEDWKALTRTFDMVN